MGGTASGGRSGRTSRQNGPTGRAFAAVRGDRVDAADPSDPRARRTRALLRAAVLELAAERDVDSIGVADITQRASVNRATFYLHYRDRDDLLLESLHSSVAQIAEAAAQCRPGPGSGPVEGPPAHLVRLLRHVDERRALYARLLGPTGSARFVARLRSILADAWCAQAGPGLPADGSLAPVRLQAQCIAGALVAALAYWTGDDDHGSPEAFASALWPVLRATTETAAATGAVGPGRARPGR